MGAAKIYLDEIGHVLCSNEHFCIKKFKVETLKKVKRHKNFSRKNPDFWILDFH